MSTSRARGTAAVALAAAAALAMTAPATAKPTGPSKPATPPGQLVSVQLLAVNDFHGQLEPPTGSSSRVQGESGRIENLGGAEYLATHLDLLREDFAAGRGPRGSLFVSAGDSIGGTPFLSAAAKDEPTVEFLNAQGLTVSATGNHEYDEGIEELLRMQEGGCHPVEGCFGGDGYEGAEFTYLSANVYDSETGQLVMPESAVRKVAGVEIGFIGVPLEGTPTIISGEAAEGISFGDELEAVNRASAALSAQGVETQVLLLHQGDSNTGAYDACALEPDGPASAIATQADAEVDAVFTGHTHNAYVCQLPAPDGTERPFVQGAANGRIISEIQLTVDRRTGDVVPDLTTARNNLVTRDVPKDAETTALIERYSAAIAEVAAEPVGTITTDITRTADASGETPLGNLIADAQRVGTGADIAFMNPGGVRGDLILAQSADGEAPGVVTYREAFTVQPFGNVMTTIEMTGAQVLAVLQQQFTTGRVLQPSGITYTISTDASTGVRTLTDVVVGAEALDPEASYTDAVNNFLVDGGDGFTVFREGTNRQYGEVDLDVLIEYLGANPGIAAPATDRIDLAG